MNVNVHSSRLVASTRPVLLPPARPEPRTRDFGIGYGNSSGYFHKRRYAGGSAAPRFRLI
ncbi:MULTISPECIES: hypothetical protein [unclassified Luteimonas]